jgi:hypothetical protein
MLTVIEKIEALPNGTFYKWDDFSVSKSIPARGCVLNTHEQLTVTVSGHSDNICSACNNDGHPLNFDFVNEKTILSPIKTKIILTFSRPVYAAGAKIGVSDFAASSRPFKANVVAIDISGNPHKIQNPIDSVSTDDINAPPALFLGAISKDNNLSLKQLEFSVERISGAPTFQLFAIGSLFYMQNEFR